MMMMSSRALKGERPAEGIKIDGGTFIASNITIVTITLKIWPGYNTGNITMMVMVPQISSMVMVMLLMVMVMMLVDEGRCQMPRWSSFCTGLSQRIQV